MPYPALTGLARSNLLRRHSESNLLLERHVISPYGRGSTKWRSRRKQWKRKRSATAPLFYIATIHHLLLKIKNTATKIYLVAVCNTGADDRTRTGTDVTPRDFKSLASAISPHRHEIKKVKTIV